ncbi:GTP cyclohydrolase I FolE2 [bacterium]|nr:GTP cyclohydrolase I FolE2 [bacterium]
MKDVQGWIDERQIAINKVGIKSLKYPIAVLDKDNEKQSTVAEVDMYVDLPKEYKGTHMSRFIEIFNEYHDKITMGNLIEVLQVMRERLNASRATMEVKFPYFIKKKAPVSGSEGWMDYQCAFIGDCNEDKGEFILKVKVPITSLCPCSKEISAYGAHNQRSFMTIEAKYKEFLWLEDIIRVAETSGSCELYPLLKRVDEKYVTEFAYDHPAFAEDIVRNAALKLIDIEEITWFRVQVENIESIHNHSAYACIEHQK